VREVRAIESKAVKIVGSTETNLEPTTSTREEPSEKRRKGEHQLMNLIDDMHSVQDDLHQSSEQSTLTAHEKVQAEISRYSLEPGYPFKWWKDNASRYPLL
jgi:hypothetical protein